MNVNVSPASASCAVNGEKTVVPALSSSSKLTSKVLEAAGSCGASSTMSVTWSCRCTVLYCTVLVLECRYRRDTAVVCTNHQRGRGIVYKLSSLKHFPFFSTNVNDKRKSKCNE